MRRTAKGKMSDWERSSWCCCGCGSRGSQSYPAVIPPFQHPPFLYSSSYFLSSLNILVLSTCGLILSMFPPFLPSLHPRLNDAVSSENLLTSDGDCIPSHFSVSNSTEVLIWTLTSLLPFFSCCRNLPPSPTSVCTSPHLRGSARIHIKHKTHLLHHGHTDDVDPPPPARWNASGPPT
jgi:hypothetical protein